MTNYNKKKDFDFVASLETQSQTIFTDFGQTVMVHIESSGNMFGHRGTGLLIQVSGNRNIYADKGDWRILGKFSYSTNIARGANGPNSSTATCGRVVLSVDNNCNAVAGLSATLGAPRVWLDRENIEVFTKFINQ